MQRAGFNEHVIEGALDWSPDSGFRAGQWLDPSEFSAVFAANDEIALGFMSAMEKRGHRAPSSYSIVGVDDMPTAKYFSPSLTTCRLDFQALGEATFQSLQERIRTGKLPTHRVLESRLMIRDSTGPLSQG